MKVVITTSGKFHNFDMARQLEKRDALEAIYTGYPRFKLRGESLPERYIHSYPYFQTLYMGFAKLKAPAALTKNLLWRGLECLDKFVADNLPTCDAFIGLSSAGLRTGRVAKGRGAIYACDRGSAHIGMQSEILDEEYRSYGISFAGVDPRVIAKEEAEYALADVIFVPSRFSVKTFVDRGVPESKLAYAPYGVDLKRFTPVGKPEPDAFDVLFVGKIAVRKGIRYLLEAFKNVVHPKKRLTLVGSVDADIRQYVEREIFNMPVELAGQLPQSSLKERMSRASVLVLPSVEDGYGMVMSQAMACGCPVVASDHTGGPDLITHGVEGFIFPARDTGALTHDLQRIADDPDLRSRLSAAALTRVSSAGGWDEYGETIYGNLLRLTGEPDKERVAGKVKG